MGLDGGTKITRSDVLRGQSWRLAQADTSRSTRGGSVNQVYQQQQLDEQSRRAVMWSTCVLSGLPLQPPLVCDALGQLMNRQAVLEHLLATKSVFQDEAAWVRHSNQQRAAAGAFDHLRGLKDVFAVTLTESPDCQLQQQQQAVPVAPAPAPPPPGAAPAPAAAAPAGGLAAVSGGSSSVNNTSSCGAGSGGLSEGAARWVCPVTLLPCASKQPFSALKPCGHVISGKALAELKSVDSSCPVCGTEFDSSTDVVLVNGSSQHMEEVRSSLRQKASAKAAAKAAKQASGSKGRKRQCAQLLMEQQQPPSVTAAASASGLLVQSAAAAAAGVQQKQHEKTAGRKTARLE